MDIVCLMHPPRLRRLDWVFARDPVYFITFCTASRKPLLNDLTVQSAFHEFAEKATAHRIYVGRYVIMPDHIHLFAAFGCDAPPLSSWVKSLKNALSKSLRVGGVPAPHWQKGFFDHVLRSTESYRDKWDYVAQNPVRAGLVQRPGDWPHQGEIHVLRTA